MPKIQVEDSELYYEIHGEGHPLLLIAGFACDHSIWQLILDELSKNFQVVIFDNRGSGQSTISDHPYSVEMLANDALDLVAQLEIEKPHLLGHSLGGAIAQEIAINHGDKIDKLVLANTTAQFSATNCWVKDFIEELFKQGAPRRQLIHAMIPWGFSEKFIENEVVIEKMIEKMEQNPFATTLEGYVNQAIALKKHNARDRVKEIQNRTLILSSDQDLLTPQRESDYLHAEINSSKIFQFSECGHNPMIEQPLLFSETVSHWLSDA
ncbi:MAG: alpha/beta hydrolase [Simkaniaceae bacterium]|nr:alpha/beta hydrolase [Simkaniaceae bacterium]